MINSTYTEATERETDGSDDGAREFPLSGNFSNFLHSALAFSNQPKAVAADQVYYAVIPFHSPANGMAEGIEGDPAKHAGKENVTSGGKSGRECSTRFLSVA